MRHVLTDSLALTWWRAALAGEKPQVTDDAHAGWYKRKLVKDAAWVPIRIWWHQDIDAETGELLSDAYLCADVDGRAADPNDQWLWCCMQPISEKEFQFMTKLSRYAKARDKREPLANPRKPIDLLTVPAPQFKPKRRRK